MSKSLRVVYCAFLFAIVLLVTNQSFAQTSFGQISGTVLDQTGATVPGAEVAITEQGTQISHQAVTDNNGFFIHTNLPIGTYTIIVTKPGFTKAERQEITVVADAHVTSNFTLSIGSSTVTVQVEAGSVESLNTTSGEVARIVDSKQVSNLALNGRNYTQLMTLVPGAVVTNPDIFAVTTSLASNNQTINGNRADSGNLTVDGAYNQVAGSNGSLMNIVGPDFIQEVKIDTSNASAEYGRTSGPSFNIVTKSGSNAFHGGAFEFLRNNWMDATNYIAKRKTQLVFNDFGWFLGGPIIKEKLFFFGGMEWKRLRQQATASTFTVPSTAMLNGDFSALLPATQLYYPGTSKPIPNNNIAALMTPDGKAIANLYHTMTGLGLSFRDGGIPSNNLTLAPSNPLNFSQDIIRIDWVINQKNSLYGRWIHDSNILIDPYGTFSNSGVLPTTPTKRSRPGTSYLLSESWNITPTLINQATANVSWASQHIPPYGNYWQRSAYGFQYNKLYPGAGTWPTGIPAANITSYAPFQGPNFALHSPSTDIQVADTLSWVKGNHLFKFGVVVIRDRVDQNGRPYYTGNINFNPGSNCKNASYNTTCYALADALTGNFNSYQEASADPIGFFRFTQPEAFAQDNWKILPNLSIEYGVRWQKVSPWYTQQNNMSSFDQTVYNPSNAVTILPNGTIDTTKGGNPYNGLVRAGNGVPADQLKRVPNINTALFPLIPAGAPRGFWNMDGGFGPRAGFAYSYDQKTVLRGGLGLFYYRPEGNVIFSQVNLPPFLSTTEYDFGNLATLGSGAANTSAILAGVSALNPHMKSPYTWQYSLGVQRQLPKSVLVEVNYVGNVAHHAIRQPNINFPDPSVVYAGQQANKTLTTNYFNPYAGFTAISQYQSDSNANYNALQAFASKRAGIVQATISYTWSKALGDSQINNITLENWKNLSYNYGPVSNDRRQSFVASFIIQGPTFKGHSQFVQQSAGGWQLSGVARLQSGAYYNITGNSNQGTRRTDYVQGQPFLATNRGPGPNQSYINKAAFTAKVPDNRFGNSPYGAVQGPGLAQTDATLSKFFPFGEHVRLKFQVDAFNVLNRSNWSAISTNASSSNFGTITAAYPPRQLQVALKLLF